MAKVKRNWMWRRLDENATTTRQRRPVRCVELRGDPTLRAVRDHAPHPTTPALERFTAMTERILIGDDYCVVWQGGDTFRVDEETVTTPARFYWQAMTGERLQENEALRRTCKTPRCVKHKERR